MDLRSPINGVFNPLFLLLVFSVGIDSNDSDDVEVVSPDFVNLLVFVIVVVSSFQDNGVDSEEILIFSVIFVFLSTLPCYLLLFDKIFFSPVSTIELFMSPTLPIAFVE